MQDQLTMTPQFKGSRMPGSIQKAWIPSIQLANSIKMNRMPRALISCAALKSRHTPIVYMLHTISNPIRREEAH